MKGQIAQHPRCSRGAGLVEPVCSVTLTGFVHRARVGVPAAAAIAATAASTAAATVGAAALLLLLPLPLPLPLVPLRCCRCCHSHCRLLSLLPPQLLPLCRSRESGSGRGTS